MPDHAPTCMCSQCIHPPALEPQPMTMREACELAQGVSQQRSAEYAIRDAEDAARAGVWLDAEDAAEWRRLRAAPASVPEEVIAAHAAWWVEKARVVYRGPSLTGLVLATAYRSYAHALNALLPDRKGEGDHG